MPATCGQITAGVFQQDGHKACQRTEGFRAIITGTVQFGCPGPFVFQRPENRFRGPGVGKFPPLENWGYPEVWPTFGGSPKTTFGGNPLKRVRKFGGPFKERPGFSRKFPILGFGKAPFSFPGGVFGIGLALVRAAVWRRFSLSTFPGIGYFFPLVRYEGSAARGRNFGAFQKVWFQDSPKRKPGKPT